MRKARVGEPEKIGNRQVVKAIVFGDKQPIQKEKSATLDVDPFYAQYSRGFVIEPPLNLYALSQMEENNPDLTPCIDAMVTNIEGFGGRLVLKKLSPEVQKENEDTIKTQKSGLRKFLLTMNPKENLTSLRMKTRKELELMGNAFWELVPSRGDSSKIVAIYKPEAFTMRLTARDKEFTEFTKRFVDEETGEVFEQIYHERFRRFVQQRADSQVYFKEYGDPRIIDRRDGKAYKTVEDAFAADVKPENYAHAVIHFNIFSSHTSYGMPRYSGNMFSVFGSRAAEEINFNTLSNNNIPNMAVLVSGNAMLTEGTINRIKDFQSQITKKTMNASKFLLLEAEPASDSAAMNSSTAKIDIIPLKDNQHTDQLFQNYDKNNSDKVTRCWRIPGILIGKSGELNRATSETARKLAEEQVFQPQRQEMDRIISQLFNDMGFYFWEYKSYSPNVTDDEDIVKILSSVEKTGAMTPNFARELVADVLNKDPEYYPEDAGFDPDIPFSLTMAEAVKGQGSLGGNPATGAIAPNQGQIPKMDIPPIPEKLAEVRQNMAPDARHIELVKEWEVRLKSYLDGAVPDED